jgi:hypothetical protein
MPEKIGGRQDKWELYTFTIAPQTTQNGSWEWLPKKCHEYLHHIETTARRNQNIGGVQRLGHTLRSEFSCCLNEGICNHFYVPLFYVPLRFLAFRGQAIGQQGLCNSRLNMLLVTISV